MNALTQIQVDQYESPSLEANIERFSDYVQDHPEEMPSVRAFVRRLLGDDSFDSETYPEQQKGTQTQS